MEIIDKKLVKKENDIGNSGQRSCEMSQCFRAWAVIYNTASSCLALCWFIISKTGVGVWVYIPGFFFEWVVRQTVACKVLFVDQ